MSAKTTKILYIIFNIAAIAILILLGLLPTNKLTSIITLCLAVLWIAVNLAFIFWDIRAGRKIIKTVAVTFDEQKYDECIEKLTALKEKIIFPPEEQMIVFYMGYAKLFSNDIQGGISDLLAFDLDKQYRQNAIQYVSTVYLLYTYGYIYKRRELMFRAKSIAKDKSAAILSVLKRRSEEKARAEEMFRTIELLEDGRETEAAALMHHGSSKDVPFIKSFIEAHFNKKA